MALWIELWPKFQDAYEADPRDESLIERICSYAGWCEKAPRQEYAGHDPFTAVVVAFFEHIPTSAAAREDMPRWFSYEDVLKNRDVFSYLIENEEYQNLLRHMEKNEGKTRKWDS